MGRHVVRSADGDAAPAVARVLEGALLAVPVDIRRACDEGRVLLIGEPVTGAVLVVPSALGPGRRYGSGGEHSPAHLLAVAVIPSRRGEGQGQALVGAAAKRWSPLSVTFDRRVKPFYESLGFAIARIGSTRFRGVRAQPGHSDDVFDQ
ncbi:MAG: N-acetyltransferase [Halobacteriaceae archaeon]